MTDAIGFILAIGLILGFLGLLGGGAVETSRKRPYLIAIVLLAIVGGGYYFTRPAQPLAVTIAAHEVVSDQSAAAFCFQSVDGTKGAMIGMDDETIVIKADGGKIHTYGNGELRTVACD
ncbi:hypothetical protein HFO56_39335 [Rhizobium laguerreae]|uniref:hypothetical protein n=1 Tax=Rhizobium laguerreae TaxID=1076926 RepID=UPI001C9002C2|nr:hypothetical protein [Rhizobium laguerreae]MBY3158355.1 hypothetical protein [Rhizobium laguerreae]